MMYKILIIIFFISSILITCQHKKENISGEWIKLTIQNKDSIILNPCNNENRKIIIQNDSLLDFTGQEKIACKIIKEFKKGDWNYIVLDKNCYYSDTISYKIQTTNLVEWKLYNNISFLSVSSKRKQKYKIVDEKCNDHNEIAPKNEYNNLLLHAFTKKITPTNINQENTSDKISTLINHYSNQADFGTYKFYDRESKKFTNPLTESQLTTWKTCNTYLDFSDVISENSIESNWRYPYDRIQSISNIYKLYKNKSYGDSYDAETLKYHIALYMYFLPWGERKKIYNEIDTLKNSLSQKSIDYNGLYELTVPAGMVKENSPELKIKFTITNNKNVDIQTSLNGKITDYKKGEGSLQNNAIIINSTKDSQREEYIIKKTGSSYNIPGSSVEELNPFAKEMDLKKL